MHILKNIITLATTKLFLTELHAKSLQSCLTPCNRMDCISPGSSIYIYIYIYIYICIYTHTHTHITLVIEKGRERKEKFEI